MSARFLARIATPPPRSASIRRAGAGLLAWLLLALLALAGGLPSTSAQAPVAPPTFSSQRGFYSGPLALTLASATAGASIRYTLDGSTPGPASGALYSAPINIATTTVVRALAYTDATAKSPIVTHTFIFLGAVRTQSATPPPGWPANFAAADADGSYPADYALDPQVTEHPNNSAKFAAVMRALPSLSIVTDLPNLWDPDTGIYYNSNAKDPYTLDPLDKKWERPISLEWIGADGSTGFAAYGGMRIHGQASRRPNRQPKKNFRLYFKSSYGTPRLDFQLFDEYEPVTKFDRLVVRNGGNRSWSYYDRDQRREADYVNDEWARRAWLQMGHLAPHGTYAHVYLNGLYWGLYNITERIDEKFIQAYLGLTEDDYDVIGPEEELGDIPVADAGTLDAYNELLTLVTGTDPIGNGLYQQIAARVDLENLADYFIHAHYIGKTDWPHHNWDAFRQRSGPDTRFKFIPWDNDTGLEDVNINTTLLQDLKGPDDAPSRIFLRLTTNAEFRQLLADRLYTHVVEPRGVFTPAGCAARYSQLAAIVDQAVIGESARWGDYMRDVYPPGNTAPKGLPAYLHSRDLPNSYTDPTNVVADTVQKTWLNVRDAKLADYCPKRSAVLVSQYTANGWYQVTLKPPAFSLPGGAVAANAQLTLSNSPNGGAGTIYYTTDGSDPRAALGAVAAGAVVGNDQATIILSQVTTVKARVRDGTAWSPLAARTYYPPQPFGNLAINEIHYHPAGASPDEEEFIELHNRGASPLRLDNLAFTQGISYRFAPNTTLAPGGYLALAAAEAGFMARYNAAPAGAYRGSLANEGEVIELVDALGNLIDRVAYGVSAPWPAAPNGGGSSLSLRSPAADNGLAASWAASATAGGTPGRRNDVALAPAYRALVPIAR